MTTFTLEAVQRLSLGRDEAIATAREQVTQAEQRRRQLLQAENGLTLAKRRLALLLDVDAAMTGNLDRVRRRASRGRGAREAYLKRIRRSRDRSVNKR